MAKTVQPRKQSKAQKDVHFEPYDLTLENLHTSILLLGSSETEIVFQTLREIMKFAARDVDNCHALFNLNAIKYILLCVDHQEVVIRRVSLKVLAQLCQLPGGPEQALEDPEYLRKIALLLVKDEDVFVLEFASLVLAQLTKIPLGCMLFTKVNILGTLLTRMRDSLDPDVQRNCLQILSNLLDDPVCVLKVTTSPQFSWPVLMTLVQSKFVAIQFATLAIVDKLICRYQDRHVQKTFQEAHGAVDLCEVSESHDTRAVHPQVLDVLRHYVKSDANTEHLHKTGCVDRILGFLRRAPPSIKPGCLAILTQMSFHASGRDALYDTEIDLAFCQQLMSSDADAPMLTDAAIGVANMTKLLPSAIRMSKTDVMEALSAILGDDLAPWFYVRINTLQAMAELCRVIPNIAYSIVEPKTFNCLRSIHVDHKNTPMEAQRLALQVYINLQNYYVSAKGLLSQEFLQEMLDILQRIDINLKLMSCTVLTGMMAYDVSKDFFSSHKGEAVVSKNLRIEHVGLRTALCTLISASVTAEGAHTYHKLGTINYMVNNRRARYAVRSWDPAIQSIFRLHPSAKLAYTGRLDLDDFTSEGFYCPKRLDKGFPTLQEFETTPALCTNPVFICLFNEPDWDSASEIDVTSDHSVAVSKSNKLVSNPSIRFIQQMDDTNLRAHLLNLKMWFGDTGSYLYRDIENGNYMLRYRDKCDEVSTSLKQRAIILADYVTEQMSGVAQRDCSLPSVELHLANLMVEQNSPIIGIGWVKCGGSLERALLYKVLADRICLPCSLHRATSAYAWCEVAVPDTEPEDDKEQSYPAGLLRANYVVDLTGRPGRLLPRESREARLTCGPKCAPAYTAATRAEDCVCVKTEESDVY
ncbi:armadillo repeat-containing protein 3-like [Anticarsia gemmatalis]|uniref:armadillo repeat-containing protein 3-like n=1 Tax=Anticarsia gemmatalis TaxID=129554 RepID=UPI003F773A4F